MSGEMFRWLATPSGVAVKPRGAAVPAHLLQFNQTGLVPKGWSLKSSLLDSVGFVYAPAQCRGPRPRARCSLHVHYHPCGGSWRDLSTSYMLESGIAAYAVRIYLTLPMGTCSPCRPLPDALLESGVFTRSRIDLLLPPLSPVLPYARALSRALSLSLSLSRSLCPVQETNDIVVLHPQTMGGTILILS